MYVVGVSEQIVSIEKKGMMNSCAGGNTAWTPLGGARAAV